MEKFGGPEVFGCRRCAGSWRRSFAVDAEEAAEFRASMNEGEPALEKVAAGVL